MDLQSLVEMVLGMSGFGALVSALVNALKSSGIVKDNQAQVWVTGLNLLGVIALYGLGLSGTVVDLAQTDATLGLFGQVVTASGNLLLALGGSKIFYGMVRGAPVIGKSHSV